MEELKNENVTEQPVAEEPVVEQRPSTKYGRTAYQQQLQEEQAAWNQAVQESSEPAQNQPQQTGYQYWEGSQNPYQQNGERPYQQYQNQYNQPQFNQPQYQQYTPYEEAKPEVKEWIAYVLMGLVAALGVLSFIGTMMGLGAYGNAESLEDMYTLLGMMIETPGYEMLALITDLVRYATIAFLVLDIFQLHKAGKKIGGAIAFAIFLRPAYFIWRAHLLGNKKTLPIIFAVCVFLLSFVEYGIAFAEAFEMVVRLM